MTRPSCSKECKHSVTAEHRCFREAQYWIPDEHNPQISPTRWRYGNGYRCTHHTPKDMRRKEWKVPSCQ